MMSLWDALRMNMMISYQELVRTFLNGRVVAKPCTIQTKEANVNLGDLYTGFVE